MSKTHEEMVNETINHNVSEFMEKGPGLRYTTQTVILAVDEVNNAVLVGGLGAMGVGQMWFNLSDHHKSKPEYATAPRQSMPKKVPKQRMTVKTLLEILKDVDPNTPVCDFYGENLSYVVGRKTNEEAGNEKIVAMQFDGGKVWETKNPPEGEEPKKKVRGVDY